MGSAGRATTVELGEQGLDGWTPCGGPVSLDAAATAAVCEEGAPGSFSPPEGERRCGRIPTTLVLRAYCEPGEGDGRALRYEGSMDTTSEDEMLSPSTLRRTHFEPRLGYGQLYQVHGSSASNTGDPSPLREARVGHETRWVSWVTGLSTGTQVRILFFASERTSTFTRLDDGGVSVSSSEPVFYYIAGLDHSA